MPLIDHQVQSALRKAGIIKDPSDSPKDIQGQMSEAGMSVPALLEQLRDVVEGADSTSVKLRGIDTALKLHGVLKDQTPPPPSVTIVISDPEGSKDSGVGLNPILIPRQVIPIRPN